MNGHLYNADQVNYKHVVEDQLLKYACYDSFENGKCSCLMVSNEMNDKNSTKSQGSN